MGRMNVKINITIMNRRAGQGGEEIESKNDAKSQHMQMVPLSLLIIRRLVYNYQLL